MQNLLEINNLSVAFHTEDGIFKAVDDVSFNIKKGEIVGLVGESGCGKSVTALGILRLLPCPPAVIENGEVFFKDQDLLKIKPTELRKIRGRAISMIFQNPLSALSPLQRIGTQLVETLRLHEQISRKHAWKLAENWLEKVRIPDPGERMFSYPFQLSGGMQQRVMIAMAMMTGPDMLIADEPTTALDVTIQAQIFRLVREMRHEKTSILLITHDMGVIWEMCDRVMVMYASGIAEQGEKNRIFSNPAHPYTRGLLNSIPKLTATTDRLNAIPGQVPSPLNYPIGCHFRDRCSFAFDRCSEEKPRLVDIDNGHSAACFIADKLAREGFTLT
ncbi:MAG: ABC transporter ATP-binding protein [Desulfobacteraceae bacterium]|nr:ABC transporter ATP-binding protein [Desulfobacteraceae bacterium]